MLASGARTYYFVYFLHFLAYIQNVLALNGILCTNVGLNLIMHWSNGLHWTLNHNRKPNPSPLV